MTDKVPYEEAWFRAHGYMPDSQLQAKRYTLFYIVREVGGEVVHESPMATNLIGDDLQEIEVAVWKAVGKRLNEMQAERDGGSRD